MGGDAVLSSNSAAPDRLRGATTEYLAHYPSEQAHQTLIRRIGAIELVDTTGLCGRIAEVDDHKLKERALQAVGLAGVQVAHKPNDERGLDGQVGDQARPGWL